MELRFEQQSIQFVTKLTIEALMDCINELIGDNQYFSHCIVDNIEMYEELDGYLADHLNEIDILEVKAQTVPELVEDILFSAVRYCERALVMLPALVYDFKSEVTVRTWDDFFHLLEGMEWLYQMFCLLDDVWEPLDEYVMLAAQLEVLTKKLHHDLCQSAILCDGRVN